MTMIINLKKLSLQFGEFVIPFHKLWCLEIIFKRYNHSLTQVSMIKYIHITPNFETTRKINDKLNLTPKTKIQIILSYIFNS